MAEELKPWVIRDVPERTRRRVKAYAADQGISMAEALEQIVDTFDKNWKLPPGSFTMTTLPAKFPTERREEFLALMREAMQEAFDRWQKQQESGE